MFDDANRFYSSAISVNSQSVIMAVLWISLLIVVFHLIRKRIKLVQNFGVVTVQLPEEMPLEVVNCLAVEL